MDKVLLEKLIVAQLIKKLSVFYENRKSIATCTRAVTRPCSEPDDIF